MPESGALYNRPMPPQERRLVILTGMSGAGKSTALKTFEDLGYYCLDNLPPTLIGTFIDLYEQAVTEAGGIAVVCDIRSGTLFARLPEEVALLTEMGRKPEIVFLDCEDDHLVSRCREGRRVHPLGIGLRIEEAVRLEREQLGPIKDLATHIIDTTDLTVQQLRARVLGLYGGEISMGRLSVTVLSFGFKFGIPADADFLFDTRFLPNPFYVEDLRPLSGNDQPVVDFVMSNHHAQRLTGHIVNLLSEALPLYVEVHKLYSVVAIGCTGGRHRSVAIANAVTEQLRQQGMRCVVQHRDLDRLEAR